jgi:hypothetical protein
MGKAELAYIHGLILDAALLKTRTSKKESLSEYAVLRGKDLEDSLL